MSALPPDEDRTVTPLAGQAPHELAAPKRTPLAANALGLGTRLGEFEIVGLVGEGGFGIVYLAYDHSLDRKVAVKEYMPSTLAQRKDGATVTVRSERHADTFAAGLRSFVNEARLLAQFDHPSLVKVYRFWEANGTAYMAMPFYEGVTLKGTLRQLASPPDEAWLKTLLKQLLAALEIIHSRQCYHRDIAPDNILMLPGNVPVLLDFGAARRVVNNMTQALTVILKPGYAPIEQYAETPDMRQGAWTDLYALASVVFFAITGRAPAPAVARVMADPVVPLVETAAGRYSEAFLAAVDAAMSVAPGERPQSIAEFRDALGFGLLQTHPALREYKTQASTASIAPPARTAAQDAPSATHQKSARTTTLTQAASDADGELERLLAQYIGPLAKIIVSRARKASADPVELVRTLASSIDNNADREAFISAAIRRAQLPR